MALDTSNPEIQFAMDAARQAGLLVRDIQRELVTAAITKEDRSPVTVADFAAQAVVGAMMDRAFPGDPLVGEESAAALRAAEGREALETVTRFVGRTLAYATPETVCAWIDRGAGAPGAPGGRFWTVDPIDGTKGFLRAEQYAVALALVADGAVRVGALACPNLADAGAEAIGGPGSLVIAARGQGTWTTPLDGEGALTPLRVSETADMRQARVLRSVEAGHTNVDQMSALMAQLGVEAEPARLDSQAKYALLASGAGDLLLRLLSPSKPDYREMIWDQAAGSIVVEEAGGVVTDLDGRTLDFSAGRTLAHNRGVVASNGALHKAILAGLKEAAA